MVLLPRDINQPKEASSASRHISEDTMPDLMKPLPTDTIGAWFSSEEVVKVTSRS